MTTNQPTRKSPLIRRVAFAFAVVCALFVVFIGVSIPLANEEREHGVELKFTGVIHVMEDPDKGPDDVEALNNASARALESGNMLITQLDERTWRIVLSQIPITDLAVANSLQNRNPKFFREVSTRSQADGNRPSYRVYEVKYKGGRTWYVDIPLQPAEIGESVAE